MKKRYLRMTALIAAMMMTLMSFAQAQDSLSMDTTLWFNQTQQLDGVVVKGRLPKTRVKGDAMRTTVAGTILEKAGTVSDALSKIPSLEAERDGAVKVLGRGDAEVYINGRRVQDVKELSRLRSDQIQHVDVVQNPGARYAASVKAVVRITLKKAQGEGLSFQNSTQFMYQYGGSLNDNFTANYRTGGLDVTGSFWVGTYNHYKGLQVNDMFYYVGPNQVTGHSTQEIRHPCIRVHYKLWNGAADSKAQNICFVHGFGCDMNTWEKQFEAFRDESNLQLLFIDLPGYGQSDKPHVDYTLDFFAYAIDEVLNANSIQDAIFVGHSLGTPVCRQTLMTTNHQGALVDVDGVYCFYDGTETPEYVEAVNQFGHTFDGDDCRDVITGFVSSLAGKDTPQEITDYAMSVMPETPQYVASSTMQHLIEKKWWPHYPLTQPVMVICTQNSGLDPDNDQKMQALYPHLDYTELTTCGHFIHMEQPEMFNDKLKAFIAAQMPNRQAGEAHILFEIRPEVNYVTHLYTLAGLGFSDEEYTSKDEGVHPHIEHEVSPSLSTPCVNDCREW